jgi:hypothetical protein
MHHTTRPKSRPSLRHAKVWSAIAVGLAAAALTTIMVEPPARASLPAVPAMTELLPVIVTGEVGPSDSTCNVDVSPKGIVTLDDEQDVEIELAVAAGVTIEGWDCEDKLCVNLVSAERIAHEGVVWLRMQIDNGDPNHLGGAWMFVTRGEKKEFPDCEIIWNVLVCDNGWVLPLPSPGECCGCPCDFAPNCD